MLNKLLFLWIYLFAVTVQAEANLPRVVVTVKPIHALVSGVMKGVAEPYLLLQGGESPHSFSMKPSQIKQLNEADLVVWVGHELETFLEKTITHLNPSTLVLTILEKGKNPFSNNKLKLFIVRAGHEWEPHEHEHAHDNEQNQKSIDPHVWLDPNNAIKITQMISAQLITLDAAHAVQYQSNADALIQRLEQLDQTLKTQLLPIKTQPFIVFHDAYQYLEQHYGLNAIGAVSLSPERSPSAKQLHHLQELIKGKQVGCIFVEPQFSPTLVNTLVEDTQVKSGTLDPLGSDLIMGEESYFTLLHNLVESLTNCLKR